MKPKVLLTGGGSAGHVWPVIAVAKKLKNKSIDLLYVGSRQGFEKEIAGHEQIEFAQIFVGKWRGYFSLSNFLDLFKTLFGLIQSFFVLIRFKPNVVFAKGGYVSYPVLFWARSFNIPVVIHESDSIPGKANLWASRFARKICVGFPIDSYQGLPKEKMVFTGTPIQDKPLPHGSSGNPVILITGGSQGSHFLNATLFKIMPQLLERFEIYHIAGAKDYADIKKSSFVADSNYHLEEFTYNMSELMRKADLIISRSGASTLAEISGFALASILIPYPYATAGHQAANAKFYDDAKAAVVMQEKDLTPEKLLDEINQLMSDSDLRQDLARNAHTLYQPDSDQKIFEIILNEVKA